MFRSTGSNGVGTSTNKLTLPYGDEFVDVILTEMNEKYLDSLDEHKGTNVVIPGTSQCIETFIAIIKGCKRDRNGNLIDIANPKLSLDTCIHELEFTYGELKNPHIIF